MKKLRLSRDKTTGLIVTEGWSIQPKLQPPAGHSSWLEYAAQAIDYRELDNEHGLGLQPQWPGNVTRKAMRDAVASELRLLGELLFEVQRVSRGARKISQARGNPAGKRPAKDHGMKEGV